MGRPLQKTHDQPQPEVVGYTENHETNSKGKTSWYCAQLMDQQVTVRFTALHQSQNHQPGSNVW